MSKMTKKVKFLLCGFFIATVQSTHAASISGQDLLDGFSSMARFDAESGVSVDAMRAVRIAGYIQGTIDSAVSAGIFCIKGKTLTIRLAQPIIIQYLKQNPSKLKESAVETVVLALHPIYKCEK